MSLVELLQPIIEGGIRNTNFFNGRLLTAEDLQTEQAAHRLHRQRLGRALGEGVAYGLNLRVAPSSTTQRPVLRVSPGLAFNRKGEPVALNAEVDVALAVSESVQYGEAGLFAACAPPGPVVTNPGLYLFTAAPASELKERAPVIELGAEGMASRCASRYAVEGVKFGLARVNVTAGASPLWGQLAQVIDELEAGSPPADPGADPRISRLRNILAHLCFGTEQLIGRRAIPMPPPGTNTSYGVIEALRDSALVSDCEVPLALVSWGRGGLQFIDAWAVRRHPAPIRDPVFWSRALSPRRREENVAAFLQFQTQIQDLLTSSLTASALANVEATSWFRYLPPVGLLPVGGIKGSRGFDSLRFFEKKTTRKPVFVEASALEHFIGQALDYPPIDLANPEMIWIYMIRENQQAIDQGVSGTPIPCLVFSNAHIPDQNNARFDVARFSYSNYL